eukprot:1181265-Prorocentrum_minimum.AAC.2
MIPLLRLVLAPGTYCLPSCDWFSRRVYTASPPAIGSHAGYVLLQVRAVRVFGPERRDGGVLVAEEPRVPRLVLQGGVRSDRPRLLLPPAEPPGRRILRRHGGHLRRPHAHRQAHARVRPHLREALRPGESPSLFLESPSLFLESPSLSLEFPPANTPTRCANSPPFFLNSPPFRSIRYIKAMHTRWYLLFACLFTGRLLAADGIFRLPVYLPAVYWRWMVLRVRCGSCSGWRGASSERASSPLAQTGA